MLKPEKIDLKALRKQGIDVDDTTPTPFFTVNDGKVVSHGNMSRGWLNAYNAHYGDEWLWVEGHAQIGDTYDVKTAKLQRDRRVTSRVTARPVPEQPVDPPPLPRPPEGTLAELVEAMYWREKGNPAPMQRWITAMDRVFAGKDPNKLFPRDDAPAA